MSRRILIIFVSLFLFGQANSQFGFQSINGINYFSESQRPGSIAPENSIHFSLGPSYWFRLKNKRIEFNPGILFDYNRSKYNEVNSSYNILSEHSIVLSVPILFYPFDFGNDCNCPTFNKSGQLFEKGFHFILYSALPYSIKKVTPLASDAINIFGSYHLGIGAGLDFGINKKITLSPSLLISKTFEDTYLFDVDNKELLLKTGDRIRVDLMLRVIWYQKKKRY